MKLVILGQVAAIADGRPVRIDRAQRRAVLAYLLLQANHVVATDQLVDAVWGMAPPATARRQVFAAVSVIRRAMQDCGHDPITSVSGGYRLTATPEELDLLTFGRHRERAQHFVRDGQLERAVVALRSGLHLWRGQPLGGVSGAFVDRVRTNLEDQRLSALETLLELELELGHHHAVVAELADVAAANPLREQLAASLMVALYRSGRPADALDTYRRTRRILSEDLGIEPGQGITALHDRILHNDDTLRVPAPRQPTITARRRFLPHDIADFTGRSAELDRLACLLTTPPSGTDVVVIGAVVGVGGIGKTALAVHWAHRIASKFPDGQLYVNLRGYDDRRPLRPADALGALLRALGTPPDRIPADLEGAAAVYRATLADQRVLILLDNARSAEQVRPLLPSSPGSLVLITSRDALSGLIARDGARRLDLDLLPRTDAVSLLARILGADRVAAEVRATEDLVVACGYLPLALRIAAANLAALPTVSIASYVRDVLGGGRLESLAVEGDSQSSMRRIFDQSYRHLDADRQRAFQLLGYVPGPDFTAPAAASLIGRSIEHVDAALLALTEAHLVVEHRPGRFILHDLVREYARVRADALGPSAERTRALTRLTSWMVASAEAAAALVYPVRVKLPAPSPLPRFATAEQAREWLTAELANLMAVVETGMALGNPEAVWRLMFACGPFLSTRIERGAMLALGNAALAAAAVSADPRARAASELVMAQCYTTNGYDDRCLPHTRRCIELARQIGWQALEGEAHNALSVHHLLTGDLRSAAHHARSAFDQSIAMGIEPQQYLGKLGLIEMLMGSLATASDYFEQTLASSNHQGYSRGITLLNLAEVRTLQGRPAEAEDLLCQAIQRLEDLGNSYVTALAKADLAVIRYDLGQCTDGWDLIAQAGAVLAGSTDVLGRTQLACRHGHLLTAAGRYADAIEVMEPALTPALQYGNQHPVTQILIALARAYAPSDPNRAADFAARAVDAGRKGQFRLLEGQALNTVALSHLLAGRPTEAQQAARAARRIHTATGHLPGLHEADRLLAESRSGPQKPSARASPARPC